MVSFEGENLRKACESAEHVEMETMFCKMHLFFFNLRKSNL